MVEKIRAIQNPLTIIAIFAALAEIAGTVALAAVDKSLQPTFIWFVMIFPTLLVILFFVTLNFNSRVLYAPSDFKDEDNFLSMHAGRKAVTQSFENVTNQLEMSKRQIIEGGLSTIAVADDSERTRLEKIISEQIDLVYKTMESAKESAISSLDSAEAHVVRCDSCKLVQFRPSSGLCRRCHMRLDVQDGTIE